MKALLFMARPNTIPKSTPARDLCPVLTTIRVRIQNRLAVIDEEILAHAETGARDLEGLAALQGERATLVETLELIVTASARGLERETRRQWLETLLRSAPECVTPKARQRLRLLIDGLSGTSGLDPA